MPVLPVGARPLTRRRYAAGSWNSSGRYVNGAATDTTFWGSYQPIKTDLQREPGGERRKATHVLSALTDLQVSLPNGGPVADQVIVPSGPDAGTFQVESVQAADAWSPIPHYEADIYRLNEADPVGPDLSTTVAERLLQACRALIKASNIPTPFTDSQVVVQEASPMPRPALPYLAVIVDTHDQVVQATDSQAPTWADLLTVTGGTEGDTYTVAWDAESVVYTRTDTDTNADVATALCAALIGTGTFETEQAGASFALTPVVGAPVVSVDGPLSIQTHALPATVQQGLRASTLSLLGYGTDSRPWIERARAYLASPAGLAIQRTQGVAVQAAGDIVPETVDLGTGYELRYSCVLTLSYSLWSVAQTGLEATTILVGGSVSSSNGQPALPFTALVEP